MRVICVRSTVRSAAAGRAQRWGAHSQPSSLPLSVADASDTLWPLPVGSSEEDCFFLPLPLALFDGSLRFGASDPLAELPALVPTPLSVSLP